MSVTRYRKKPVVIEAIQYHADENDTEVRDWILAGGGTVSTYGWPLAFITLEGALVVSEGDYVIRGIAGEFYPCKPAIFAATYEVAE